MKKTLLSTVLISSVVLGSALIATQTAHADQNGTPRGALQSQGSVKFFPDTDPIDPIDPVGPTPNPIDPVNPDPDDDDPTPTPGTDGPLSLNYVPDLYFGLNKISIDDQIYNAYATPTVDKTNPANPVPTGKYVPIYTQVTDERGAYTGWTLTVAQKDKFTSEDLKSDLGDATEISFKNQALFGTWANATQPSILATDGITLLPDNQDHVVMSAAANEGEGTWASRWGDVSQEQRYTVDSQDPNAEPTLQEANVDTSVQLKVPGSVEKLATRYVTDLNWTLSDTPADVTPDSAS
ncbi:WxL domain-containing protein [Lactococcus formosensis]|jgi:hypothetical protein|uniref:WxL domain-containing protein n=1 Tax=Lactococcus formosensis TaxID=1281486 RepID=A0A9Q8Y3K7_9LACT|nr:WxL domain-containing protein [Lactococcus formosensis]USJ21433.1 WxL domain-containing protein [Lactococcus formosensis]